jgi:hypothetical protein
MRSGSFASRKTSSATRKPVPRLNQGFALWCCVGLMVARSKSGETVDRYIDEFERLLEQVARDDRGQVLTKTYLTSDTGKVYTLLAHAAGRLG